MLDLTKKYLVSKHFPDRDAEPPILKYQDIKNIIVFKATRSSYHKNEYKEIACLYRPDSIFRRKDLIDITLEEALKLLKTRPSLFSHVGILSHLYRYVSLYDKSVISKIEKRILKRTPTS